MTVTQQLADALRELLVAVHYADPPKNYGTEDEPNICHEARIPVGFVEPAHRALTAFEASRAAPAADDVVERVARAIYNSRIPKGGKNYMAFDDLCSHDYHEEYDSVVQDARAALAAMPRDEGLEGLLAKALRRLAFWAQTSGGTAGRDDGLVAAIDVGLAALRQYDTKLAQEPRK